jgi:hypothetical protein
MVNDLRENYNIFLSVVYPVIPKSYLIENDPYGFAYDADIDETLTAFEAIREN